MSCRSDNLKTGVARAPHRSLLKALGFVDEEMGRPVIGIANSFNEIIPGHVGLKNIVQAVKRRHSQRRWCTNRVQYNRYLRWPGYEPYWYEILLGNT